MKHKTLKFKDTESVAAWLNRKSEGIDVLGLTTITGGLISVLYRERSETVAPNLDDTDFVLDRLEDIMAERFPPTISLSGFTNSVRNLTRFSGYKLPELREHLLRIIAQSDKYDIEPKPRGYDITLK